MNPNNYVKTLIQKQGKSEAKRIVESTLKLAEGDVFWTQVNNLLKKVK